MRNVVVVVAALLLRTAAAGCGTDSDSVSTSPPSSSATADSTNGYGTDASTGTFPRTVRHAAGTTTIEHRPERVVVLDSTGLDGVLSLGITPVGLTVTKGATLVPGYLSDRVVGVPTVGTNTDPDLEAIAALGPDLILGGAAANAEVYDELSGIAPTVMWSKQGAPWKENFRLVGLALGMETESAAALDDYAAAVAGIKTTTAGSPTISLLRWAPGKASLYGNSSLLGVILRDAGLPRPTNQDVDQVSVELSMENLGDADADLLFYSSYGDPATTGEADALAGPIWQQLPVVRRGDAIRVDDDIWFLGLGPTGARLIVEQLGGYLAAN